MAVKNLGIIGQGPLLKQPSLPKPTPAPAGMDKFAFGELKQVDINTVLQWKNNPRKNDAGVPKLATLLKLHGQKSPIVVWRKNNVIYKGNTTHKAMKYNGATSIWVLFVDFPSEQAAEAYGIADNKSSEWSDWDDELLRRMMVSDASFTSTSTGFSEKEIKAFQLSTSGVPDRLPNIDLEGDSEELGEFLIITFKSKTQMEKFKEAFSLSSTGRKIEYDTLVNGLQPDWVEFISQ